MSIEFEKLPRERVDRTGQSHPAPLGRPIRVLFLVTSLPFGGAETLLVNLVRRLDRRRFAPEVGCLKARGPLGDVLAEEIPVFERMLAHKYDLRVLPRLIHQMRARRLDAVVTVGDGDKSFWGRLAAWWTGVPVICYASHMQGWPSRVEWLNRRLTPITDFYIAVANTHGRYLLNVEGFPQSKIRVIHNGVDVQRFRPLSPQAELRDALGVPPEARLVSIVAALRQQKNHEMFLRVAQQVHRLRSDVHFLVVGDGDRRSDLLTLAQQLQVLPYVHFLGSRTDVPELLAISSAKILTSHSEANPVSLLEAMACEKPVVATSVGSVADTVTDGWNGFLIPPGDERMFVERLLELLDDPARAEEMGRHGRERVVALYSVEQMVRSYESLIEETFARKTGRRVAEEERSSPPRNGSSHGNRLKPHPKPQVQG